MRKPDIKLDDARTLKWDDFEGKGFETALVGIYQHATKTSQEARDWYWTSIKNKRRASSISRGVAYLLAGIGVVGPLFAASRSDPANRLLFTQIGVTAIAVAALIQLCDTVFGWSSGWLRYISTVTAMEKLTLQFQLDWAGYCVARKTLADEDKKPLFDMSRSFELEIEKRRAEETDGWVAEFNRGMAALNEMIKFQKDATEKASAAAKSETEAKTQAARPGAIEANVVQSGPLKPIRVHLDGTDLGIFKGPSWAATGIVSGAHQLRLEFDDQSAEANKIVDVPAGGVARVDVKLS